MSQNKKAAYSLAALLGNLLQNTHDIVATRNNSIAYHGLIALIHDFL
jgi:hypothetical protein